MGSCVSHLSVTVEVKMLLTFCGVPTNQDRPKLDLMHTQRMFGLGCRDPCMGRRVYNRQTR